MASKITDYPAKTTFNDGDLYDVSTFDGVTTYTSEKMTFLQLKGQLPSFYTSDDSLTSARTVTLTSVNTLTFNGGLTTFKGQDATSSNYAAKFQASTGSDILVVRNDSKVGVNKAPSAALDILQNTVGTTAKGFSVNFGGSVGESFYLDDNGSLVYNANIGATFKGSNGIIKLVSNGGTNPTLKFQYVNGSLTSGELYGRSGQMFLETPSFGLGASGFTLDGSSVFEMQMTTENCGFSDAGSAGATQQDWIEVTVGGNTGYIRVYAAK
jgi:hypothetical protein